MLQRKQHVLELKIVVNNEPVPGWGHDPQDMLKAAGKAATEVLGSYDPIVIQENIKDLDVEQLTDEETSEIIKSLTKEAES